MIRASANRIQGNETVEADRSTIEKKKKTGEETEEIPEKEDDGSGSAEEERKIVMSYVLA